MFKNLLILGVVSVHIQAAKIEDCQEATEGVINFLSSEQGPDRQEFLSQHNLVAQFSDRAITFHSIDVNGVMVFNGIEQIRGECVWLQTCSRARVYVRSKQFKPSLAEILFKKAKASDEMLYCPQAAFHPNYKNTLHNMDVCCFYNDSKKEGEQKYTVEQEAILKSLRTQGFVTPCYQFDQLKEENVPTGQWQIIQ